MWVGEGEKIGEEDEQFDEVSLLPPTMKSVKLIWRAANELIRMAYLDVGSVAQQDLVRKCRSALDRQFLNGAGAGVTMPKGLLQPGQEFLGVTSAWDGPAVRRPREAREVVSHELRTAIDYRPLGLCFERPGGGAHVQSGH
jgi:hypothetical protein